MSKPPALTARRRDVLDLLAQYGHLRTEHFYELMEARTDTRRRAVRRILTLMRRNRLIQANTLFEYHTTSRGGFPQVSFIYSLLSGSTSGARSARPSSATVAHDTLVSEYHLSLARSVQLVPHLKLHWLSGPLKKTVNPDAIFGIEDPRNPRDRSTYWFFLEVERSKEGHWRGGESALVQKLERYSLYRGSNSLRSDWPFIGDFRVIVNVPTHRRAENLLLKLRRKVPLSMIWIGVASAHINDEALHATYRAAADGAPRSMASLFI